MSFERGLIKEKSLSDIFRATSISDIFAQVYTQGKLKKEVYKMRGI